jgi:hypothetical protein
VRAAWWLPMGYALLPDALSTNPLKVLVGVGTQMPNYFEWGCLSAYYFSLCLALGPQPSAIQN